MRVVIAPFSNDTARDWPLSHYSALIDLILHRANGRIDLIGSGTQRLAINLLTRGRAAGRVWNGAGRLDWSQIEAKLCEADVVIANNSGIAHFAANLGLATVCIFAATHLESEWGPRGPAVVTLSTRPACSPCAGISCQNGALCLTAISPEQVLRAADHAIRLRSPATAGKAA